MPPEDLPRLLADSSLSKTFISIFASWQLEFEKGMISDMERLSSDDWSKQEKEIARRAFSAALEREYTAIAHNVRKMAAGINELNDIWEIHDYLTEKRKEMTRKYEYRYSVLISVFGFLMSEGWIK